MILSICYELVIPNLCYIYNHRLSLKKIKRGWHHRDAPPGRLYQEEFSGDSGVVTSQRQYKRRFLSTDATVGFRKNHSTSTKTKTGWSQNSPYKEDIVGFRMNS